MNRGRGSNRGRAGGSRRGASRGRGRGRGGGRGGKPSGRGRSEVRSFTEQKHDERKITFEEDAKDSGIDMDNEVDDEKQESGDENDGEIDLDNAAPLAYNALLTLLADDPEEKPRKKRRKTGHAQEAGTGTEPDTQDDIGDLPEPEDQEEPTDEIDEAGDPFDRHFADPSPDNLEILVNSVKSKRWSSTVIPIEHGRMIVQKPELGDELGSQLHPNFEDPSSIHLKHRLQPSLAHVKVSQEHATFASHIFSYHDVSYNTETHTQLPSLRSLYSLHALNHIYKTRDKVIKNNAKLSSATDSPELELRDQGFTRPKILILLPTRNACLQVVENLIKLSKLDQVENRKRFYDGFRVEDDPIPNSNKPESFKFLFSGNTDDAFRMGIKFTRKTMKLFSQFYASDIILASPLGLRMAIGDASEKKQDYDFLSSIEMVVLDSSNAMLMQNWEHVDFIYEHLNLLPKESHGCDYGRVRNWILEEKGSYLRQSIILGDFDFPESRSLFNSFRNVGGKARNKPDFEGGITAVGAKIRQTFLKFSSTEPSKDPNSRFEYFVSALIPRVKKSASQGGLLLFIPSYFDFLRVRNYLDEQDISHEAISEYSPTSTLTRSRHLFASSRSPILVITERLHHFRRYELKGVRSIIFYQAPKHTRYYIDIVRTLLSQPATNAGDVRVMFSKWDEGKMERLVGTKRVGQMMGGKDTTFEFV